MCWWGRQDAGFHRTVPLVLHETGRIGQTLLWDRLDSIGGQSDMSWGGGGGVTGETR